MNDDAAELAGLLTAKDVASVIKVKASTVYEAAANGRIPCVKLWQGRKRALVRFRRSDIERWLQERTQSGGELQR